MSLLRRELSKAILYTDHFEDGRRRRGIFLVLRLPDNAKIYSLDFTVELDMYCTAAKIRFETETGFSSHDILLMLHFFLSF